MTLILLLSRPPGSRQATRQVSSPSQQQGYETVPTRSQTEPGSMWLCDSRLKCCSRDRAAPAAGAEQPQPCCWLCGEAGGETQRTQTGAEYRAEEQPADPAVPPNGQDSFRHTAEPSSVSCPCPQRRADAPQGAEPRPSLAGKRGCHGTHLSLWLAQCLLPAPSPAHRIAPLRGAAGPYCRDTHRMHRLPGAVLNTPVPLV